MNTRKGRPSRGESRAERPRGRVRVSGHRDILTVYGKDPDYEYRWVMDTSEGGSRIRRFVQGGYEFVTKENDNVEVGDDSIRKTDDLGTLVRVPAGPNSPDQYLYLMRIAKEYYEEDKVDKERELRAREAAMFRKDENQGQYGEIKVTENQ